MSGRATGTTLPELLAALALLALGLAVAVPSLASLRNAGRAGAGARHMASLFHDLRWQAVSLGRYRGLFFDEDARGWRWRVVEDGNGNGLRTAEVRDGTDPVLSGPHRLSDRVEHVRLGFPGEGPFPRIPPKRGSLSDLSDPVKFGRSNLVSFSPIGGSSSGTLYVTDGVDGLYGVVLFGPSTRTRVWRFDPVQRRWSR